MVVIAALVGLDQLFKWLTIRYQPELTVGPLELSLHFNRLNAFSLPLLGSNTARAIVSSAAIILFTWLFLSSSNRPTKYAAALIIAGGTSNLADRIMHRAVVDVLTLTLPGSMGGIALNLADLLITAGSALLLFSCIRPPRKQTATAKPNSI